MSYKQNPGRGDSPKTGCGIPSPLKQVPSNEGPKTKKMRASLHKQDAEGHINSAYKAGDKLASGSIPVNSGTVVDKKTGKTSAKPYGNKFSIQKESGDAFVTNASGKTVGHAKSNPFNTTTIDKLRATHVKDSISTMDTNQANAEYQNNRMKIVGGYRKK
jgi:hypothetical protein